MLVLTKDTVLNPGILKTRSLPRRFLGRVSVWPKGARAADWARLVVEAQFLRYLVALAPFIGLMFVWEDGALAMAHAPLPMVALIIFVEMRVLRISDTARKALLPPDVATARLETLGFRARAALRDIAARRGIEAGELHLVVEQSDLARVAPLTLVTVQSAAPKPHILDLDAQERALVRAGLFDDALTERQLHEASLVQKTFLHSFRQEARAVSAHARLAARLQARQPGPGPGPDPSAEAPA